MKYTTLSIAICFSLCLAACNNETTTEQTPIATEIQHTATNNEMVGEWEYKDLDFDFKINVNIPGIETMARKNLDKALKEQIGAIIVQYNDDGTFQVKGNENVKGNYKIENGELVHSAFSDEKTIMNYAKASVANNTLTLQISEQQFWKMLETVGQGIGQGQEAIEQMKKIITIKQLTYNFQKI